MIRTNSLLFIFVSYFLLACTLHGNEDISQEKEKSTAKVLYAKYQSFPKIVYSKQRFNVVLELNVFLDDDQFFRITSDLDNGKNITLTNKEIIWYMNDDNQYEATLNFKINDKKFVFPSITISLFDRSGKLIDSLVLKKPNIQFRKIAINQERYSNIIADKLQVVSSKARQFSNDEIMLLLEMDATNGNLEDFFLEKYKNQGIKDIVVSKKSQKIFYFVMVPIFEKEVVFNYYNPKTKEFIGISVPIELKEELVSTQTNLNPYENDMTFYKKIILIMVILILLMIYLFRKKRKYLIIAMLVMIILISFYLPNKKILIKANEKVYILPTQSSTIFKILKENEEAEILKEIDGYTKILFKNNQIGWIKNDRKN